MKKNNRKGFTIVELVIVIAVIAILAAVLIPTFSNMVSKANDSATLQEARNRYTNYTAEYDYAAGGSPEQNLLIKIGEKYVVVKGAQMDDTVYENEGEALKALADNFAVAGAAKIDADLDDDDDDDVEIYAVCTAHADNDDPDDDLCDNCGGDITP